MTRVPAFNAHALTGLVKSQDKTRAAYTTLFTTLLTQTDSDEMDGEEDTSITTLPAVRRDRSASNAPRTPASSKAKVAETVGFN